MYNLFCLVKYQFYIIPCRRLRYNYIRQIKGGKSLIDATKDTLKGIYECAVEVKYDELAVRNGFLMARIVRVVLLQVFQRYNL